jgi:hypothetical protein
MDAPTMGAGCGAEAGALDKAAPEAAGDTDVGGTAAASDGAAVAGDDDAAVAGEMPLPLVLRTRTMPTTPSAELPRVTLRPPSTTMRHWPTMRRRWTTQMPRAQTRRTATPRPMRPALPRPA